jgi:hypothetical protein
MAPSPSTSRAASSTASGNGRRAGVAVELPVVWIVPRLLAAVRMRPSVSRLTSALEERDRVARVS